MTATALSADANSWLELLISNFTESRNIVLIK